MKEGQDRVPFVSNSCSLDLMLVPLSNDHYQHYTSTISSYGTILCHCILHRSLGLLRHLFTFLDLEGDIPILLPILWLGHSKLNNHV